MMGEKLLYLVLGILLLAALYACSFYNYLLFHNIAEIFSVIIAGAIFVIAWNTRQYLSNNFLLFLGIAYLFVGGLDLLHTFSYKGIAIFEGYSANLATQLWIAARSIESLSMLAAFLFFERKFRVRSVFLLDTAIFVFLLLSIFYWRIFPVCFVEGMGLTPFKKISEYLISFFFLCSAALLVIYREKFDDDVRRWIIASIGLSIASELTFTTYAASYDPANLLGHYLKILSFWCIYKALIETGLRKPYALFFRELKQSEAQLEIRVRERTAELTRAKELLQTIIDNIPVMICLFNPDGNVRILNSHYRNLIGLDGRKIGDTDLAETRQIDPTICREVWSQMKQGQRGWKDFTIQTTYGKNLQTSWARVRLSDGSVIGIGIDISERKRSEEQKEHYLEQLKRSNKELQDFAFVASHDLQEPLRKIQSFGELLVTEVHDSISAEGRDFLVRMQNAATRMRKLIDSLLAYSRVTTKTRAFSQVNLVEAVEEALGNLAVLKEEKKASVEVGELPTVEGDQVQMIQLFQNLIGNALKFHRKGVSPEIKIYALTIHGGRSDQADVYEIFVKDNGIGFDESYLSRIFTPFQRLHGKSEYEGVGIGLAICRKIVERHGGHITATSNPGGGAVFIVTLPKKQK
ncbi:PAS domain S-box protein [delta proteobacterium NaphS2]|nr:PAS domain S-box protein [delta proteobacterium NaphS2]